MLNIQEKLYKAFNEAIIDAYPGSEFPTFEIICLPYIKDDGDYRCRNIKYICTVLSDSTDTIIVPRDIASIVMKKQNHKSIIRDLKITDDDCIDIFLKHETIENILTGILRNNSIKFDKEQIHKNKVLMVHANFKFENLNFKTLRSIVIGDCISRILEFQNYEVVRLGCVKDWGDQAAILIANYLEIYPKDLRKPPVLDIKDFIKKSNLRFKKEQKFKKSIQNYVSKLKDQEVSVLRAWRRVCNSSKIDKEFNDIFKQMNIKQYQRGYFKKEKFDWAVYIIDNEQSEQINHIKKKIEWANILKKEHTISELKYDDISGDDKWFTGNFNLEKMNSLLNEGLRKAEEKLKLVKRNKPLTTKEFQDAKESIAYGCIKYSFLSSGLKESGSALTSEDKEKDIFGNHFYKSLSSLSWMKSIPEKLNIRDQELRNIIKTTPVSVQDVTEWKLAKILIRFPEILSQTTSTLNPKILCDFTNEISCAFAEFYQKCCIKQTPNGNVISLDIEQVLLLESTAILLENCYSLLGLKTVKKL